MDENLVIDLLQISRLPLRHEKILSDHFTGQQKNFFFQKSRSVIDFKVYCCWTWKCT